MLTIYTYASCDTCRRAVKWLREREVKFQERPIRETPPSSSELQQMLDAYGGDLRRLFNTSGRDFREQKLGEKIEAMKPAEAFRLMAETGNLVKRPFLIGPDVAVVGFDPAVWSQQPSLTR